MHIEDMSPWTHSHVFHSSKESAERGTRAVMWITLAMMIVEITAGWFYNSMALLADGWHMSSHALAIGLSALAYSAARRYANDRRFAFGTWKIEILGGYTSAILLLSVAAMMVYGSVERLFKPQAIHYQQAIAVAIIGLLVNMVCTFILAKAGGHGHAHGHHHDDHHHGHDHHDHAQQHHDLNLKSAYIHVLADAATSVLAIVALAGGWIFGWSWLDPVMGLVGAALVAVWAVGLIKDTSSILLDREMDHPVVDEIKEVLQALPVDTKVADLHVWRVGQRAYACAATIVTHDRQLTADAVRARLAIHEEIVHTTVEIHLCPEA